MLLVADPGFTVPDTPDIGEANTLFATPTGNGVIANILGAEVDAGAATVTGGNTLANGGATHTAAGPDAMHSNPNMILFLRGGGVSYKFWNVDVTTITNL